MTRTVTPKAVAKALAMAIEAMYTDDRVAMQMGETQQWLLDGAMSIVLEIDENPNGVPRIEKEMGGNADLLDEIAEELESLEAAWSKARAKEAVAK